MAGYHNYSMSNNAVTAYINGEKPLSKWTKSDVIEVIAEYLGVDFDFVKLIKPYRQYLVYSGWHHTSKFYNETSFYEVNLEYIEEQVEVFSQKKVYKDRLKFCKQKLELSVQMVSYYKQSITTIRKTITRLKSVVDNDSIILSKKIVIDNNIIVKFDYKEYKRIFRFSKNQTDDKIIYEVKRGIERGIERLKDDIKYHQKNIEEYSQDVNYYSEKVKFYQNELKQI